MSQINGRGYAVVQGTVNVRLSTYGGVPLLMRRILGVQPKQLESRILERISHLVYVRMRQGQLLFTSAQFIHPTGNFSEVGLLASPGKHVWARGCCEGAAPRRRALNHGTPAGSNAT
jgi:hypothetical protein